MNSGGNGEGKVNTAGWLKKWWCLTEFDGDDDDDNNGDDEEEEEKEGDNVDDIEQTKHLSLDK